MLEPGTRLGGYEIGTSIGAGGMGEVYKARDTKLGRDVAIKVLPESLATPELLERFEREARAVAALSHPNIVAIHDFAKDGTLAYIVTELLEGETLRERLEKGSLPVSKAVDFTIQICRGLGAAHGKGIVHRDLKPDNLFLTEDGMIKILDFGLAKVERPVSEDGDSAPTQARGTSTGVILGTIGYMSPEQVRGHESDHRSDIFSLGGILYEMLAGERAFRGSSSADTMSAILKEDPPEHAGIPPAPKRIILRCLEKDPEERFQSARELRFALETLSDVSRVADETKDEAPPRSIAVLPFKDMSPQKDQDYFCEGMAEEITNALTQVPGLRVASASQFGGKAHDVRQVGEALSVSHLLEGSVRTAGKKLRITAQLVNVADGYHLWSERFDREMEDVFAIQDEIASNIVGALRLQFGVSQAPPAKRHSDNLEAYHLYLKGRHAFERRYRGGPHNAVAFYEEAVALDPSYALAHAGRGDCYTLLGAYGFIPPDEAYEKVQSAVRQALDVDEDIAEAHTTLARFLYMYDGSLEEAEREFLRALELNPSEVQALCWYSLYLATAGRWEEAKAKIMNAIEVDPLSAYTNAVEGVMYTFYGGSSPKAIEALKRALEIDPDHSVALYIIGMAFGRAGEHERAIAALTRVSEISGRATYYLGLLAWAYGDAGREDEARSLLEELHERAKSEYVGPMIFAGIHGGLREKDQTMEWLARAVEDRSPIRVWLEFPLFDDLRDDPRFLKLQHRLGLR